MLEITMAEATLPPLPPPLKSEPSNPHRDDDDVEAVGEGMLPLLLPLPPAARTVAAGPAAEAGNDASEALSTATSATPAAPPLFDSALPREAKVSR